MLGPDHPVELRLLEITPALKALEGVVMELDDCAFPLLAGVEIGDDPNQIFDGVNLACLVGARPRSKGMERGDLLEANGAIFKPQGQALNDHAADDVKVLVTGNPANTNALIAMSNAPDIPAERFNALTRLDHNRAKAQLAAKAGVSVNEVRQMTIWGNHSATQYPDLFNAEVGGRNAAELIDDQDWLENTFLPTVQKRGAAIIEARGASSAASAANATVEHMRDWVLGTPDGDWVSMAVPSDGSYGVAEGLISSFPCTTSGGAYTIVQGCDDQRLLPGQDRRQRRRAGRGAGRGPRARPDRAEGLSLRGASQLERMIRSASGQHPSWPARYARLGAMSNSGPGDDPRGSSAWDNPSWSSSLSDSSLSRPDEQPPNPWSREGSSAAPEPEPGLGAVGTPPADPYQPPADPTPPRRIRQPYPRHALGLEPRRRPGLRPPAHPALRQRRSAPPTAARRPRTAPRPGLRRPATGVRQQPLRGTRPTSPRTAARARTGWCRSATRSPPRPWCSASWASSSA